MGICKVCGKTITYRPGEGKDKYERVKTCREKPEGARYSECHVLWVKKVRKERPPVRTNTKDTPPAPKCKPPKKPQLTDAQQMEINKRAWIKTCELSEIPLTQECHPRSLGWMFK